VDDRCAENETGPVFRDGPVICDEWVPETGPNGPRGTPSATISRGRARGHRVPVSRAPNT